METRLFVIREPKWTIRGETPDGILQFLYSLCGVECPQCGTVTISQAVIPMACPVEIRDEIRALYDQKDCLSADEFHLRLKRWQQTLAESYPGFTVRPGATFSEAVWYPPMPAPATDDIYFPLYGPVCSSRVRNMIEENSFSGTQFAPLCCAARPHTVVVPSVEMGDMEFVLPGGRDALDKDFSVGMSPFFSLMIITVTTFETAYLEFGGYQCQVCSAFCIPKDRQIDYQRTNGIARSKLKLPARWVPDADIFKSHVFGSGAIVVRPHVHSCLQNMGATGFQWRELRVEG